MRKSRRRTRIISALAFGAVLGLSVGGCGDGSPTELPPASLQELFGNVLYLADGSSVGLEVFDGVPVIGIYFGAGSCPACASYTPDLVAFYDQLAQAQRPFEVVYVSGDGREDAMFSYMQSAGMEWPAVPWNGPKTSGLVRRYDIQVIPTLVVIDSTGATITRNGRDRVYDDAVAAYDDWLAEVE